MTDKTVMIDADVTPLRMALAVAEQETADTVAAMGKTLSHEGTDGFNLLGAAARKSGSVIEKTLMSALKGTAVDWKSTIADMATALGKLAIDDTVIKPLSTLLSGSSTAADSTGRTAGSFGRVLSSALTSLFGGARASGGTVGDDRAYLVGEQGPELFVPRNAGRIVPNGEVTAGRSANSGTNARPFAVTVNVQTRDAASFQRSQGQISASVARILYAARRYN